MDALENSFTEPRGSDLILNVVNRWVAKKCNPTYAAEFLLCPTHRFTTQKDATLKHLDDFSHINGNNLLLTTPGNF